VVSKDKKKFFAVLVLIGTVWFTGCDEAGFLFEDDELKGEPENPPIVFDPSIPSFYVSEAGYDSNDGLSENAPLRTLSAAYTAVVAQTGYPQRMRIVILSNLTVNSQIILGSEEPVDRQGSIKIEGRTAGISIARGLGSNDTVMVAQGGERIVFENITINGNFSGNVYHRALEIKGTNTRVTLGNGTVIIGKRTGSPGFSQAGGIAVSAGGKLMMLCGSAIKNCSGGTVYGIKLVIDPVSPSIPTFTMAGGVISHNEGGGVLVDGGEFVMTGGEISDNNGGVGGGVGLLSGKFEMTGGKISRNHANAGGGVGCSNADFEMIGGEISGNSAYEGGGVYLSDISTFSMFGGVIYGTDETNASLRNTATGQGGGDAFYLESGYSLMATTNNTIRSGVVVP
jgi:hypothetical protein